MGGECWWGWGDDNPDSKTVDNLAELLRSRFDGWEPEPLTPSKLESVDVPAPRQRFPAAMKTFASSADRARVEHARGQAYRDVMSAVRGQVTTVPDVVTFPRTIDEIAMVMDWCESKGLACIPYGGGTSVVGGINPPDADRGAVTMDLGRMNKVAEIDKTSLAARIQAGALGPAIEDQLRPEGLTLRFFPQSWERSTLGGWIATRAGGHHATGPTRIDRFVEAIDAVTPSGRFTTRRLPSSGAGPDPNALMLGSEGSFGVISEAWVRVTRRPLFRSSATVAFPDRIAASSSLRAIAQSGLEPANCRLLDPVEAAIAGAGDGSEALLVIGFESADHPVESAMDRALELCRDHQTTRVEGPKHVSGDRTGKAKGGAGSWRKQFLAGPYLRDALVVLGAVVETFETAITWDRFDEFVADISETARSAATEICGAAEIAMRVTHAYPDGAAPYFTVIAPGRAESEVAQWDEIKAVVSNAIIDRGGTITHHHAVGRDHRPFYERERPGAFEGVLRAAKGTLDPVGIMNPGVLFAAP